MKLPRKTFFFFCTVLLLISTFNSNTAKAQSNGSYKVTVDSMADDDKALITIFLPKDPYGLPLEKENVDLGPHLQITKFTVKQDGIYLIEVKGVKKHGNNPIHLKLTKTDAAFNPFGDVASETQNTAPKTTVESTVLTIGKNDYTTTINGKSLQKNFDIAPRLHKGRTLLPARAIAEILRLSVSYDSKTRIACFSYDETSKVELQLGKDYMLVNGQKLSLTGEPLIVEGRILLPLRDIQSAFGKLGVKTEITWDQNTQSIQIQK